MAPRYVDRELFLSDIQVTHGPPELLGRAVLKAYDAAIERGITLRFGTFEELAEVCAENRDSWPFLVPMFDPSLSDLRRENSLCLMGVDGSGRVVATQAIRLFDWETKCLHDEATSLRFFYRDPSIPASRDERCIVTAEVTKSMRGLVAFSGGTWYHPSCRGRGLIELIPRIARITALTRWDFDLLVSIQAEHIAKKGVIARSGFKNLATYIAFQNSPVGDVRCYLAWATQQDLLADFAHFIEEATPEAATASGGDRRAQ
jgi:hypothetical protein